MIKSIRAGLSVVLAATAILAMPSDRASGAAGFADVAGDYLFAEQVNWLVAEKITKGCNPPVNDHFCPDESVTRGQMAAFLVRSLGLTDDGGGNEFVDDDNSVFEADIAKLAAAGITKGCNPPVNDRFCPDEAVTRGQMAAFLVRSLGLTDDGGGNEFVDDDNSVFEADIAKLAAAGITKGCNPPVNDHFCPDEAVTRGQMAAFLFRALSEPDWWMRLSMASIAYDGMDYGRDSYSPAISADGRYVAFHSENPILVPGDGNGRYDVFVHDRVTAHTERVSISGTGEEGNASSIEPAISSDGRYVAFASDASNLVPGDTNSARDVFVHDRQTAETHRVSVGFAGVEGDGPSERPAISADGRHISFDSAASNLILGDFNRTSDAFVHDRIEQETIRISVASDGSEGNNPSSHTAISADGCHVAFQSTASNLVAGDGNSGWGADVFVHDCDTRETVRVSVASDGSEGNGSSEKPAISADGMVVAFESTASNFVGGGSVFAFDVFAHDRTTHTTSQMSVSSDGTPAGGHARSACITADGRYVAFATYMDLDPTDVNGEHDIYVHDRATGSTLWISLSAAGFQGDGPSYDPSLSADGRHAAFGSKASNLVPGDVGWDADIFVTSL